MKHKFPVAQIRADGTPAIWFTHTHWLLLESGIVRAYLDHRESLGRYRARREQRQVRADWKQNHRLKDWEFLDSWPLWQSHADSALELFQAGWDAYCAKDPAEHRWNRAKLIDMGDKLEAKAYAAEHVLITSHDSKVETSVTDV